MVDKMDLKRLVNQLMAENRRLNEEMPRAVHAAFCAGIHHAVGQRELTSFELLAARCYVSEQEALSHETHVECAF